MILFENKHAEIQANDGERDFLAWEHEEWWYTVESDPLSHPHTTLAIWKSREEMIQGIAWHDWILEGVQDEDLRADIYHSSQKKLQEHGI